MQRDYNITTCTTAKSTKMKQRYSTSEVNRTFLMKVYGVIDGKKVNTLVGVSGLIKIIGMEFFNKFLDRAFSCPNDKCVCKLRRGIQVSFYLH